MHTERAALETLMHALGTAGFNLPRQRGLFLFAQPHAALAEWSQLTGWQPWRHLADAWDATGLPRVDAVDGRWPMVLILPGKSRNETLAAFAAAHDALEPGGLLLVAIENDIGAARFEKELANASGNVKSIQRNKCRAFLATANPNWNHETLSKWRILNQPNQLNDTHFKTVPGIFSEARIDAGSAMLASHLPSSLHGHMADLGAGWGYLSDAVARKCPQIHNLDLYEADARALTMARKNLSDISHKTTITYHWHDVTRGVIASGKYDGIVMNPPFHDGKRTDVTLGEAFLATAANALRSGGVLWMVANRQLPYETSLAKLGMQPKIITQNAAFKVIHGIKRST